MAARRREAKVRPVPGLVAGAQGVTEPVEGRAARRQLTAKVVVRCNAWLGVGVGKTNGPEGNAACGLGARAAPPKGRRASKGDGMQTFDNRSARREGQA